MIHFRNLSFPPDLARFHWPKATMFRSIGLDSHTLSFAIAAGQKGQKVDFEEKEILLWSGTGSRLYSRSCPWFAITKRESEAFGLLGKFAWTPCSTRALDRVKVMQDR